jgi:hypothetical protein
LVVPHAGDAEHQGIAGMPSEDGFLLTVRDAGEAERQEQRLLIISIFMEIYIYEKNLFTRCSFTCGWSLQSTTRK